MRQVLAESFFIQFKHLVLTQDKTCSSKLSVFVFVYVQISFLQYASGERSIVILAGRASNGFCLIEEGCGPNLTQQSA